LDTDIVVNRGHGGWLRDGRAGTRDLLFGIHTVLGVPGNRDHVVRSRQFFCEEDCTVVDRNRGPCAVHVLDRSGGRQRRQQRLGQVDARGHVVCLRHEPDGRPGRVVLRQGVRYDSHVFVGFSTPVQC